ncbi:MAG TPA: FHA domain-containing protein [Bdellovibrionales bacterium]|nr:FHA domain-containing protein [Bdellovibrionales bacterium]
MSRALAAQPPIETRWTILSGASRGAVCVMGRGQFVIGRSPECELVITGDPKCSRRHVEVRVTPQGAEFNLLNDQNLALHNGIETARGVLKDGDRLVVGETELQFGFGGGAGAEPELAIVPQDMPGMPGIAAPQPRPRPRPRSSKPAKGRNRFIVYGIVGLILFWLLSPTGKKKEELKLRTEQQIEADIDAANKLRDAADAANATRLDGTITSRQAQENYVRGFRDYREGQFERALTSFQACLALNPEHALCTRYLRLAQRRFNELTQYHMVLGRKYRDQNQYRACRAAFRNVMVMVKDANSAIYKEAKANYEACNSFVEGRY